MLETRNLLLDPAGPGRPLLIPLELGVPLRLFALHLSFFESLQLRGGLLLGPVFLLLGRAKRGGLFRRHPAESRGVVEARVAERAIGGGPGIVGLDGENLLEYLARAVVFPARHKPPDVGPTG